MSKKKKDVEVEIVRQEEVTEVVPEVANPDAEVSNDTHRVIPDYTRVFDEPDGGEIGLMSGEVEIKEDKGEWGYCVAKDNRGWVRMKYIK